MIEHRNMHARRFADAMSAIANGEGYAYLSATWKITSPGVHRWCKTHLTIGDRMRLARNGREKGYQAVREAHGCKEEKILAYHRQKPHAEFGEIAQAVECSKVRVWQVFDKNQLSRAPVPPVPLPVVVEMPQPAPPRQSTCQRWFYADRKLFQCNEPTKNGKPHCDRCAHQLATMPTGSRYSGARIVRSDA